MCEMQTRAENNEGATMRESCLQEGASDSTARGGFQIDRGEGSGGESEGERARAKVKAMGESGAEF